MNPAKKHKQSESGEDKLRRMAAGFIPDWDNQLTSGPLPALLHVAGRYDDVVSQVVAESRTKAKLVSLDAMGAELRPASSARSEVVLTVDENQFAGESVLPAGTVLAASSDGQTVLFETEDTLSLITARLERALAVKEHQVHNVHDKTSDSNVIFREDYLYLGYEHSLPPGARIDLEIRFTTPFPQRVRIAWEIWAKQWMPLQDSDGTRGFQQDGPVTLTYASGPASELTLYQGVWAHWIRVRLTEGRVLCREQEDAAARPTITSLKWKVFTSSHADSQILLKQGFANGIPVDPLSAFAPFGEVPKPGAAWMFGANELLERHGAKVALQFDVVANPLDQSTERTLQIKKVKTAVAKVVDFNVMQPLAGLIALLPAIFECVMLCINTLKEPNTWARLGEWVRKFVNSDNSKDGNAAAKTAAAPTLKKPEEEPKPVEAENELFPVVVLQAWTGSDWITLDSSQDNPALNLMKSESHRVDIKLFDITIPEVKNFGVTQRWMRLYLESGGFGEKVIVKTGDLTSARTIVHKPPRIVKPLVWFEFDDQLRPPAAIVAICEYAPHSSSSVSPQPFVGSWNIVQSAPNKEGAEFSMFACDEPDSGYLYLGFDGPLPTGWVAALVESEAVSENTVRSSLNCELAEIVLPKEKRQPIDPAQFKWQTIKRIVDDTAGLTHGGLIRMELPNTKSLPTITIASGANDRIRVSSPYIIVNSQLQSVFDHYRVGTWCLIRDKDKSEPILIQSLEKDGWVLKYPLMAMYSEGRLEPIRPRLFGLQRSWLRIRLSTPVTKARVAINAVRVVQAESHTDEVLGTSNGKASQSFHARFTPVLSGEVMEVLELEGKRAALDYELIQAEFDESRRSNEIRVSRDKVTGEVTEIWRRWSRVRNFLSSKPRDRHYTIDRIRGIITFGDNLQGRVPPLGADVRIQAYRHGGGSRGNVPAGAIQQLITPASGVLAVTNPRAATGGCDGDSLEDARTRNARPELRHLETRVDRFLRQNTLFRAVEPAAVNAADYAGLARSTSAEIAEAVLLAPVTVPGKPPALNLIVLPFNTTIETSEISEERITITDDLKKRIRERIAPLAPAWVASRLEILGPKVVYVGIYLRCLGLRDLRMTGEIEARAKEWLAKIYLDPVVGGPEGHGWLSRTGQPVREAPMLLLLRKFIPEVQECEIQWPERASGTEPVLLPGEIPAIRQVTVQPIDGPQPSPKPNAKEGPSS